MLIDAKEFDRPAQRRPAPATDAAEQFLRIFLADGPKNPMDVVAAAQNAGISRFVAYAARRRLGITGRGVWSLP